MTDLALAEALEMIQYRLDQGIEITPPYVDRHLVIVAAAARERLEMGEGERVWWCEVHDGSGFGDDECIQAELAVVRINPCQMVPARLFLDRGKS